MVSKLNGNFERRQIIQEVAYNILEEKQKAIIDVHDDEDRITFTILNNENDEKEVKLERAIAQAREGYSNGTTNTVCSTKKYSRIRGKGLLSILYLGWDLQLLNQGTKLIIEAIKA